MEHTRFLRTCSTIQKLPDMYKEIRYLRNKIESLEKQVKKRNRTGKLWENHLWI